jgi:hypothetical protein
MAWKTDDVTAATGAPAAAPIRPAGYVFETQGTQHVTYIGLSDNHVHELRWDTNGVHTSDLTAATGALAAVQVSPVGYAFEAQGTQHVVHIGADNDIHELWWDTNGWHSNNLTAATGTAAPGYTYLVGYVFEAQGTQHVMYLGPSDKHVHELWWDTKGWHANDLTVAAGAPPVSGGLVGYAFEAQRTQHVLFLGADGHIHELWWDENGWHTNDLTAATGTPAPGATGALAGYMFEAQGTQHVIYVSEVDNHVHELWWDSNGWHANDLTVATAAATPGPTSDLTGYVLEAQGTQHVIYIGGDNDIHELWWDTNGWHTDDLTAATGAPPVIPGGNYKGGGNGGLVGYAFEAQGTQHVIYVSYLDNDVHELWWAP